MSEAPASAIVAGLEVTPTVKLVRPLGAGGMGAVWVADHTGLKTQVVVKFMLADLDGSDAARGRFEREAAAAAKVKSPHVVQMLDHGVTDKGVPFIVMEHLEGHDLATELADGKPLPPARALAIVAQVGKALGKVHAASLLHRDIKPENIFLVEGEDDVFVKLLDFGIAKSQAQGDAAKEPSTLDGQTKTGQIVGTPFYMSPEQVTAQKEIDARADLWSLAVVAYQLLTGVRPFDGPSFGALAVKIASGPLPKPTEANPALPASLDAWFVKACAREPGERFATAKELTDALRGALEAAVSLPPAVSSGAPPKTISISPDPDARPSMAHATTVAHTPEPLARSEGAVSVRTGEKKGSRTVPIGVGVLAIALLGAAGYVVVSQSPRVEEKPKPAATEVETASATATATASATASAPATASASATATATATASASASASAPASAIASSAKDGGPKVGWRPPIVTTNHVAGRPSGSAETAPRPPTTSGDPLF